MSRQFLTLEDVAALPRGSTLRLDSSRALTPRALEEATQRGIRVLGEDGSALNSLNLGADGPAARGQGGGFGDTIPKPADGMRVMSPNPGSGGLLIVSAVGRNRPRVLAEITSAVAEVNGDIQDITQRVLSGYFNLMMIVDAGRAPHSFEDIKARLESLSREGDYKVMVQREDVFRAMHRV